jgi:hypothetical protein
VGLLWVSSCKSFFSFSFFNKTPYYLSKKKLLLPEREREYTFSLI